MSLLLLPGTLDIANINPDMDIYSRNFKRFMNG